MKTEATFDVKTQEFVIHTPNFQAAKCWAGNLGDYIFFIKIRNSLMKQFNHLSLVIKGETATHAVVFATLFTPDGENHGLHAFFFKIRDTQTFENLPGVSIGDMGAKLGLNGIDNGYI